jgi:hypothetical protein
MIPTITPIKIHSKQRNIAEIRMCNHMQFRQWAGCSIPVDGTLWQVIGIHSARVLVRSETGEWGIIPVHEVAHSLNNYRT